MHPFDRLPRLIHAASHQLLVRLAVELRGGEKTLHKLANAVFLVHGDADRTAPVEASRAMVAELKSLGVEHEYVEVPGGTHGNVVGPNIPRIVDYFLRHQRTLP
jgi:acetyl esterase/lipase